MAALLLLLGLAKLAAIGSASASDNRLIHQDVSAVFLCGFRSLTEAIDTTTPAGRMLGAFAEFERQMIRERTKLGLARARLEGRIGGNRAALTPEQQAHALAMIDEGKSQSEIAELFGVHRSTICRLVSERRVLAA